MKSYSFIRSAIALFGLVWAASTARSSNVIWTNTAGGDWRVALNWQPHQLPALGDTAVITNAGNYLVTVSGEVKIAGFELGNIAGAGTQTLTVNGGGFTLNGTIHPTGVLNLESFEAGPPIGPPSFNKLSLLVGGTLNWTAGVLPSGIQLTIEPTGTLEIRSENLHGLAGSLINRGTVLWSGGPIRTSFNSINGITQVDNFGRWIAQVTNQIFDIPVPAFPGGPPGAQGRFNNAGRFEVAGGIVDFNLAGSNSGTFEVATNAVCNFHSPVEHALFLSFPPPNSPETGADTTEFTAGASFTGLGLNRLVSGTFFMTGSIHSENLELAGGDLRGTHTLLGTISWSGGKLAGVSRKFGWSGGTTSIGSGATLNIRSENAHQVSDHELINQGVVRWSGGPIDSFGADSALLINPTIQNRGRWVARVTNAITGYQSVFLNPGSFEVETGVVSLEESFNNAGGTIALAAGAQLVVPPKDYIPEVNFNGGLLTGSGTLKASTFLSAGNIRPGAPGAILTIEGDFAQLPTGTMEFDFGQTNYSQVVITGRAKLNGLIRLRDLSTFAPPAGDRQVLLTSSAVLNNFARVAPAGTIVNYRTREVSLSVPSSTLALNIIALPAQVTFVPSGTNLVRNGDFELPGIKVAPYHRFLENGDTNTVLAWTAVSPTNAGSSLVQWVATKDQNWSAAQHGEYWIELSGLTSFRTSFPSIVGTSYELSFWLKSIAFRGLNFPYPLVVQVADHSTNVPFTKDWTFHTFQFTAQSSSAAAPLEFLNPPHGDYPQFWAIDAVAIKAGNKIQPESPIGQVAISWNAQTNKQYQIQRLEELVSKDWLNWGAPVKGNGSNVVSTDAILGQAIKYYRVVELP